MANSKSVAVPTVVITDNKLTTTSINVAEVFGKLHAHVIRDIEKLQGYCTPEFNRSNFGSVEYVDAKGETRPMYSLTRDGLTLLVMGYTSKKAIAFKLAYIEAFNKMEAKLKEVSGELPKALPASTVSDRLPLRNLVAEWVKASGQSYSTCWKQVSAAFGLAKISELPASWVPNACAWVQDRLDMAQKAIEYQSQNQECQKNDITRDICKAVTDAMQDKKMDEQISIRERVKAAFECKPLPATETAPALPESNDILPLEGPTKQNVTERSVIQFLRDGLHSLNAAYQHAGLLVNTGKCPIAGFRRSLYIACMSDINGAAAIVRAMIAAEEMPAAKR